MRDVRAEGATSGGMRYTHCMHSSLANRDGEDHQETENSPGFALSTTFPAESNSTLACRRIMEDSEPRRGGRAESSTNVVDAGSVIGGSASGWSEEPAEAFSTKSEMGCGSGGPENGPGGP
jgi:hypothetical protein